MWLSWVPLALSLSWSCTQAVICAAVAFTGKIVVGLRSCIQALYMGCWKASEDPLLLHSRWLLSGFNCHRLSHSFLSLSQPGSWWERARATKDGRYSSFEDFKSKVTSQHFCHILFIQSVREFVHLRYQICRHGIIHNYCLYYPFYVHRISSDGSFLRFILVILSLSLFLGHPGCDLPILLIFSKISLGLIDILYCSIFSNFIYFCYCIIYFLLLTAYALFFCSLTVETYIITLRSSPFLMYAFNIISFSKHLLYCIPQILVNSSLIFISNLKNFHGYFFWTHVLFRKCVV